MSSVRRVWAIPIAAIAIMAATTSITSAVTISDTTGAFVVGIAPAGELHDGTVGFERTIDGFDPILPGSPRESWGVSAGATAGWANHASFGVVNVVANGAPVFGVNTASVSSFLNSGGGDLLQVDQSFSFSTANVLQIATRITNVSGVAQAVNFARNVDWDTVPVSFINNTTVDPLVGPVTDSTYFGFEHPNPLTPFGFSAGAGGGTFGPDDYGGGFQLGLGSLGVGESTSFNIFHALNTVGQSESALRTQLYGLGASFVITGADTSGINSAAVAYGPAAVPEPTTLAIWGMFGGLGLIAARRRKRAA